MRKKEENEQEELKTERELERKTEDKDYIPVIIKRTDETLKHPDDTLENVIQEGLEQLNRPFLSLLLSAMAAGMILGFTAMSVAIVAAHSINLEQAEVSRFSMAFIYPLGFVLCIMSGTQLFTEHTATAVYPVLDKRSNLQKLIRLWFTVIIGNMIGALISSGFLVATDKVIEAKTGYISIGLHLVKYDSGTLILSAILAGWLMALGAWLVMSTQPGIAQLICIYIVTFVIGISGLHHSIAGAVEMFCAYFISDSFTVKQVIRFLSIAIIGNLIGGSVFVALLNYAHIRETQKVTIDN